MTLCGGTPFAVRSLSRRAFTRASLAWGAMGLRFAGELWRHVTQESRNRVF
jgi:hypothetical protein